MLRPLAEHLRANVAFLITGWRDTMSSCGNLPVDLTSLGAPGCFGRVGIDSTSLRVGLVGNTLSTRTRPNFPSLLGGAVVGNAATASIGN